MKTSWETVKVDRSSMGLYIAQPDGPGPFPAVVYNHGSAGGMLSKMAFDSLGPVFAAHGWVFFGPYRRGQGLSASAGKYIGDQISAATKTGGLTAGAATMVHLLETDHLDDQLAALAWLKKQKFVRPDRIAVAGNSFGGILTVFGAERGAYCAAVNSAGGAQSWKDAPLLQTAMERSVRNARVPIFFFQAANDYDLSPSRVLADTMRAAGKEFELKIYPPFGKSVSEGHTLGYFGSTTDGTSFGATELPVELGMGHSRYYDRDRPTLAAMGEVVAGVRAD